MHHVRIAALAIGAFASTVGIGAAVAATAPTAWADSPAGISSGAGVDSTQSGASGSAKQTRRAGAARTAPAAARQSTGPRTATAQSVPAAASRQQESPHQTGSAAAISAASANSTAAAAAAPTLKVRNNWQGPVRLRRGATDAAELSGIAYASGDTYYSVGDNGAPSIWQLATVLNQRSGRIRSAVVAGGITAPALGRDSEGIALGPDLTKAWVSDEIASTITQFSLLTGLMLSSVAVPSIYRPANVQGNFGLESLSYAAGKLWTANEEALKTDGAVSTTAAGSWVRLQRFGGQDLTPETQYAYLTDPIKAMSPFTTAERSGVVDMIALPNGQVLTLERELGGFLPTFRSRIYLLDFTGATDVSSMPSLANGGFTAVTKTRLWQGRFNFANFEGIALGPQLKDGSYSLVLVSDDGQGQLGQRQTVLSLTLKGL